MLNKVNIGNTPNDGTGDSLREFGQKYNNSLDNPQFDKMPIVGGTPITTGFKNLIINGDMKINQRHFDGTTFVDGHYCWDRWKATASAMTQTIEEGNFLPDTPYTLSGVGIATQVLTSPSTGNWTLPELPREVRRVQLELGTTPTPFEIRPIGLELDLCKRYFERVERLYYMTGQAIGKTKAVLPLDFSKKRTVPSITPSPRTTFKVTSSGGSAVFVSTDLGVGFPSKESCRIYVEVGTDSFLEGGAATLVNHTTSYFDISAEL